MTRSETILRQEIERTGAISFARFMELALYSPDCGYYERATTQVGRKGDFYTNVSTGRFFGELLAVQFAEWLDSNAVGPYQLVEAGAHDAQLACDILDKLSRHYSGLSERVEYWIIEPSERRQIQQQEKLEQFAEHVRWAGSPQDLPVAGVTGVIFSNELLDAFPVHRMVWDREAGQWFECGVALADDGFVWRRLPSGLDQKDTTLRKTGFPPSPDLNAILPDGFILDLCPSAIEWWRQAAAKLRQGRLLTFDYGLTSEEFLAPERSKGTLRAYYRHHLSEDPLAHPGEQDLTAHLNFTQIQKAGEEAGLRTDEFCTQAHFLTNITKRAWTNSLLPDTLTPSQLRQFQTLTHPEHLGRAFRVLLQSRGC